MVLRALDRLEEYLAAALLAAITLLTFLQVVLRYAFDTGLIWALEATTYLFGWLVLIGMSIGIRTNSHIAVDLLLGVLPARIRRFAAALAVVLSLVYALLMFYGGYTLVAQLRVFGSLAHDIPLPRWILLTSLPVGFALLSFRILLVLIDVVRGRGDGLGASNESSSYFIDEQGKAQ
ncbi:MAG: TRAP transporter small permease [Gammaproteobacteria bacterium]|jgi:C4-dicarboxylate transporter DctQ subunit